MRKIIYINLLTTIASLKAMNTETGISSTFKENPNNFYFGPEVFCLDLNSHFKDVKIDGAKLFSGLQLGYEYLNPDAFYFGLDILAAVANHGFHESFKKERFPQSDGLSAFVSLELRFGYTISGQRWLATPFLCNGGYSFGSGNDQHHFDAGISYLGGGIRFRYEISRTFNVGTNFKIFGSVYRNEKWKFLHLKRVNHHGLWGGEIGVPLIWRVGSQKRWDIELEPYFLKLNFSEVENIYGIHLLFGYHF